jgi:hypothetical protein
MLTYQTIRKLTINNMAYQRHGVYHRISGHAFISITSYRTWDQYGHEHRKDGPSAIYSTGKKEYYIRGVKRC